MDHSLGINVQEGRAHKGFANEDVEAKLAISQVLDQLHPIHAGMGLGGILASCAPAFLIDIAKAR
jgi:hypothetical protein